MRRFILIVLVAFVPEAAHARELLSDGSEGEHRRRRGGIYPYHKMLEGENKTEVQDGQAKYQKEIDALKAEYQKELEANAKKHREMDEKNKASGLRKYNGMLPKDNPKRYAGKFTFAKLNMSDEYLANKHKAFEQFRKEAEEEYEKKVAARAAAKAAAKAALLQETPGSIGVYGGAWLVGVCAGVTGTLVFFRRNHLGTKELQENFESRLLAS
eukprot:gnl/TRDRNA2_/TRDRNA2_39257_c0_seq1.p1 gnl/TRDRNA2_/TRDRNA2_39257_c0~~gnl/TRDRNA2_/TRDRNA2_39257_c0_seq1.p1  ORF type:complete len:213 (+),score=62.23 gnl/TRDRNA2_/TRDRNA2_39257_c0_seq1:61-699(+)